MYITLCIATNKGRIDQCYNDRYLINVFDCITLKSSQHRNANTHDSVPATYLSIASCFTESLILFTPVYTCM